MMRNNRRVVSLFSKTKRSFERIIWDKKRRLSSYWINQPVWYLLYQLKMGLEPTPPSLRVKCSTNWAISALKFIISGNRKKCNSFFLFLYCFLETKCRAFAIIYLLLWLDEFVCAERLGFQRTGAHRFYEHLGYQKSSFWFRKNVE